MKDWKSFKSGKSKLRTWSIRPEINKREMTFKTIKETKLDKAVKLNKIRTSELGLSQSE